MDDLNFVGIRGCGHGRKIEADVSITYSNMTKGGETTYITFRNKVNEKIAPNLNRAMYAVVGTRVYFKESDRGFKFTTNTKKTEKNRYWSLSGDTHRMLHDFSKKYEGNHPLFWDVERQLWCIDANGLLFTGEEDFLR